MSQSDTLLSRSDDPSAPALSHWLREAAGRFPQAVAIEASGERLNYAELLRAADALASQLRAQGFGPGDRIGIAATRSIDTIVAIVAVIDAGLGYVPLDLNYPPDRLLAMLEDAAPRVVLGEHAALADLRAAVGDFPTLAAPASARVLHSAAADLSYVLFTSGSTGRPKGVAMGALPLRHLIHWHSQHTRLGQAARVLQFAPLSFDVHFQEIFSTLACGGTLVLLPEAQRRDPALLLAALVEHRVERIFVPYVALQMVADAARDNAPSNLRDVVSAGEQLQVTPAIRSMFARLPGAELHNHYGPTESHVVTAFELRGDPSVWPEIPPIGLPLPHVQLALQNVQPAAADGSSTGELLLGGDTLASGYLGRPELTDERFRSDFPGLPGRWYVSGDLVRRDLQGVCTYLGRADQQLKVDGFRIEPGEIELAIMAHDGVKDAVVTAPDLPGVGKQLVAHIVLRDTGAADAGALVAQLRAHLRAGLPEYMVPVRFVTLERLPTTPSGKIDRRALPLPEVESTASASADPIDLTRTLWQELLGLAQIGDAQNLFDLGARSLLVMRFVTRLKELGVTNVSVADVYDRPTVGGIAAAMRGQPQSRKTARAVQTQPTAGVAIVGMATRTPGSADVEAFWQNLMAGHEGIRHFALHDIDASIPDALKSRSNFVAAHGVLENVERFDAAYFGVSAREATVLDPQQRVMLELCASALEHAAIDTARIDGRVGVYAGTGNNAYAPALRHEQPELVQQYGEFATMLASEKDYVATRVANRLNLNGPALSIHTACSTSLVAVAQAWHALASGQCDVALAGGVNVAVPQISGYLHVEGGMESADGHCRPFDAEASGTVFASGGGVVVLRRLEDAVAAGDTIYAVIRGVGLNNDGGDKASFTAPSVTGQAGAIRMALEHAQLSARSIGYVEAHGTGTSLGDPIEVAALTRAWREDTADSQFCGIGSVKSNLGHMAAGAGVVGLIKAALSLHREVIPGTLHYRQPNPQIDFANTPFKVVAQNQPWPRAAEARRAAVSSFGVGGTNAHVVIEEAPAPALREAAAPARLFVLPLSARSSEAALQRARDLADHLEQHPALALADVATTLMRGRKPMAQRLSVAASSVAGAIVALRSAKSSAPALQKPRLVFLFPGQGSQHPGMARLLYDEAPAFREAFDRSMAIARAALGVDLHHWLVTADPADAALSQQLAETRYAQPALFSVSYALAAWLDSLGLKADAMIGHSIGEYAAACHASVFSLEDGMAAVIARGQAMFEQPTGAMLAVRAAADTLQPMLPVGVEIAGCNAPTLTVVAGSHAALDAFATQLEAQDIGTTKLRVSHAFHSASMDAALPRIAQALQRTALQAPRTTVYSCVSGAPLLASEATDPQYWARQVRSPVLFSRALMAELARGDTVFVEVGPGQALTALLRQHRTPENTVPRNVALLGPAQDPGNPAVQAFAALGALWSAGVDIAWPVASSAQRVPLPTYPFKGERYWFTRRAAAAQASPAAPPAFVTSSIAIQPAEIVVTMSRIPNLETELKRVLSDVSGLSADEMTSEASFVDQGLDSLSLTQATLELERVFGVKLRFRRLLEDLDNIGKLARFLDAEIPADKFAPAPAPAPVAPAMPAMISAAPAASLPVTPWAPGPASVALAHDASAIHQLLQQQIQLMSQQLAVLAGQPLATSAAPTALSAPAPATATPTAPTAAPASAEIAQPSINSLVEKPFGASPRLTLEAKQDFTPAQRRWLDDFISRYNARSGKSKAFSQQHRKVMADPRVVTGFNPLWKDLVYPIVVDRSKGASLWDLDGNEYIDLLSCFGGNLLGYQPEGVIAAMSEQLQLGLEVGPQHPMAAEVAQLISEFTGMERVGFCNTGSEAVMGAMRIARTVTGRKTIAIFTNSYHGIFDEVIVRGTKQLRSLSAAPGILANAVENILVLDWNSKESLQVLRERGSELAAIMTEPIQNKYPTVQPREFVQALRQIADKAGCALIFDEVVTGFRIAPGGAQEFYGVRADIATYGKVIGGGLPFAAIAGNANWLDALDGGHWQYGDDSYPEAGVTYFAGTFVRHPLALAAARATLLHIKRGGREFYSQLNGRTQRLIDRLNTALALRGAPVKAVHCASIWRLQWDDNQKFVSLFYYLLRYHGLHVYEQFGHFVSEGMTDAHTDRIFQVFTNAIDELMALGFISPRDGTPSPDGSERCDSLPTEAPLSPGQTERWLVASYDDHARRALNESLCLGLQGAVDLTAIEAAIQDVVGHHEAFRSEFDLIEPMQRMVAALPVPIARLDLRGAPDAEEALDEFCTRASERDFPVNQAPLAALTMVQMPNDKFVVHLVGSHLILDGWAASAFVADLAQAYKARALGHNPVLLPAESPRRFAITEQTRWAGADGKASRAYWREVLRNPPSALVLGDLVPPESRRYLADTHRSHFDGALLARLQGHARKNGATLFQLLLAVLTLMLGRRSGQREFVVSIPYASQGLDHHASLMSDGVLDLPLRLECAPGDSGASVLKRVRSILLDALEYPLVTQGTIARELGMKSSGNRPPFTGVFFNMNPRVDLSGFTPLRAEMREGRKRGTLGEILFNFYDMADSLTLDLHYSTEFFSRQRVVELAQDLRATCEAVAASMDQILPTALLLQGESVADTSRTAAPASQEIIDARIQSWNNTFEPLPQPARFEQWVSLQASQTPDRIAVVARSQSITYAELERRANQIAQVLCQRGIGAGALVGLCLGRHVDMLPALLGILKTGAAYVPLDPSFPRDRLAEMAEDARLKALVTESAHAALIDIPNELQLRIDDDAALISTMPVTPPIPHSPLTDDALIYVIYTSGSTGRPKGVMLHHRGVCNLLRSMQREPGLVADDRMLALATLSFDMAVPEVMLPLVTGARTVLMPREDAADAQMLIRMMEENAITVMQATPTSCYLLLDAGWQPPKEFKLWAGAEPLPPALASRLIATGAELWNLYGPTETTVWSTMGRLTEIGERVSIGKPIANTTVWVLDEQGGVCSVGEAGEICIGGAGVALGYFERPELTATCFVPDPFYTLGKATMYRTGDLGRWTAAGTLEHMGRKDHQVKVRGYRIELGEIESRLGKFEGVGRCVVTTREDQPGDVRLVAYMVLAAEMPLDPKALRTFLRITLPEYMVPSHFVAMAALPLLPNGKIDRKSLPTPDADDAAPVDVSEPPRTPTEHLVADTMAKVLGLQAVGRNGHFFELGGHSLLAAKLAAQLGRAVGQQIRLRTLFESPTVAQLAAAIDVLSNNASSQPLRTPIAHRSLQREAPLTLMQERIRFVEEMHPGRVVYNSPSAHRLRGPMNVEAFERAFAEMVRRQPALRTSVVASGTGYVQRVDDNFQASLLPLEDLSALPMDERESTLKDRLQAMADETFVLSQGPLYKARLFRLADDEHALFFMTHHITWDGWSFDVLYTEISSLYESYANGREPSLPPLPITYGDFAQWHNDWLQSQELKDQVAYWKKQFHQGAALREPEADFPRLQNSSGRGATEWMHIENAKIEPVRALAMRAGTTLSIVVLSVYAAIMSQWLRDPMPSIGMPVRGRGTPDLEGIMGFFNNMLPIRLGVDTSASCINWIKSVHKTMVASYASQDAPFELLASELEATGGDQSTRLYQVMFSFQDARARQTHWGNLAHERIPVLQRGATEDLNLWMVEVPGGIEGGVQYNTELFLPSTAAALRDRLLRALDSLVHNPQQLVEQLFATQPAEQALVDGWSRGRRLADVPDTLAEIAARIVSSPQLPALRDDLSSVNFGELGRRIQVFEATLRSHLRLPDAIVAVSVSDPLAQIVASLAVLQSGARCLVLDSATDGDALRSVLQTNNVDALIGGSPGGKIWIDAALIPGNRSQPTSNPEFSRYAGTGSARLAIGRATLSRLCGALSADVRLLASDRVLCVDGAARGLHLVEAAMALARGAEVLLVTSSLGNDGQQLAKLVRRESIAMLHASATAWTKLIAANQGATLPLTALLDVTESTPQLVSSLIDAGATVLSIFRPTPDGVPVAAGLISGAKDSGVFGLPLAPDLVRIFDATGVAVPASVAGELRTGEGASATGLLARWRTDGVLQCLGGVGSTVFLEGCAIDVETLARILSACPGVKAGAVQVLGDTDGARRLTVWVQPVAEAEFDRDHCAASLLHALPQGFATPEITTVERIAYLPDGSLDSKLLTHRRAATSDMSLQVPATATELALAAVWGELLGITDVLQQDNFFELGGTSLTAMQAVARVEQRIGKRVSPRRYVIETLAQLAAAYDEVGAPQATAAKTEIPARVSVMRRLANLVQRS
ncbi:MAG: amino acid adenylation domain-containing protein [Burkholderiaceae bacterium]